VRLERRVVERDDFLHLRGSKLGGHGPGTRTEDSDGNRLTGRELLSGGNSFPARPIQLAGPMFSDDEDHSAHLFIAKTGRARSFSCTDLLRVLRDFVISGCLKLLAPLL